MISSCFGQTGDNVERSSRCYINSRRRGSLGKETEEVGISAFRSSCLFVFAYFSAVHLLVLSRVECFQEFSWRWWLGEVSREGRLWKSVRSRRSTWCCQFGRYALLGEKSLPDFRITRVGNFPPKKSRHVNAAGTMRPLNIVPIRLYDPDASESQFHRESFPQKDPYSDRLMSLVILRSMLRGRRALMISNANVVAAFVGIMPHRRHVCDYRIKWELKI